MTDRGAKDIVGNEGLATNVAAVASQISSLEKLIMNEIKRIELDSQAWRKQHDNVHDLEQKALGEAYKVNEIWRANQNEWRAESQQRQTTYETKVSADQIIKRLESLIERNAVDLTAMSRSIDSRINILTATIDERLKKVETFVISSQSQMGTLRALMAVILVIVAVAGFVLQQQTK